MISFESSLIIAVLCLVVVGVVAIAFSRLLGRAEGLVAKDKVAAWEAFTKAVTTFMAIIAGLIAFVRYIDQRELELAAANLAAAQKVREFNLGIYGQSKTFDQAKRVLLNEAADLVSTIATLDDLDSPTGDIAVDRFERLYHGQLVLYEGSAVATAMIDFRDALQKWLNNRGGAKPTGLLPKERSNTTKPLSLSKPNSDFMRQLALRLSNACKEELKELTTTDDSPK